MKIFKPWTTLAVGFALGMWGPKLIRQFKG